MPRAVDLQLFALAVVAGAATAWIAARVTRRPRVGAVAVGVGLALAWLLDSRLIHAVPPDLVDGPGPWASGAVVAVGAGWGASRLPAAPPAGPPAVVALALASLVGVWGGVPETSPALLAAGVILGVAAVLLPGAWGLSPAAAVVVGVAPVVAAVAGAAGEPHAVVGGLLCSATLVVVGAGRTVRSVPVGALAAATLLQLVAALVAARQVGIGRDWDEAVVPTTLVLALSVGAAAVLRQGHGRAPS